jgi:hypothetical protein
VTAERWRRVPSVLSRRSLDAVVLLAPTGTELTLAGTGAELWDELSQPTSTATLVAGLVAAHGADPLTVEADISPVLARLEQAGMIERAEVSLREG